MCLQRSVNILNPSDDDLFLGNTNIHSHFLQCVSIERPRVHAVKTFHPRGQGLIYPAYSTPDHLTFASQDIITHGIKVDRA